MGLETIKDDGLRENWRKFINTAHSELNKAELGEIEFTEFKDNGSYAKAKTGIAATKWVFAKDKASSRRWVELELKSRVLKGARCSQYKFYMFIKKTAKIKTLNMPEVTWDEEDRKSPRKKDGKDIRIKIYLKSLNSLLANDSKWISTMIQFIQIFKPIIQRHS